MKNQHNNTAQQIHQINTEAKYMGDYFLGYLMSIAKQHLEDLELSSSKQDKQKLSMGNH